MTDVKALIESLEVMSELIDMPLTDHHREVLKSSAAALSALSSHAETETEWEWGTDYQLTHDTSVQTPWHSREIAERYVTESPHDTGLIRRRKAGEWGVVE